MDYSTTVHLDLIGWAGPFAMYSVVHVQKMTSLQLFGSSIDVEEEEEDVEGSGGRAVAMFFKLFSILQYF